MNELETRKELGVLGMLAAFAGGALLGAIATLLLAPHSGADTRRWIVEGAERSRDALDRMGRAAREAATTARSTFTAAMHEGTPVHPH